MAGRGGVRVLLLLGAFQGDTYEQTALHVVRHRPRRPCRVCHRVEGCAGARAGRGTARAAGGCRGRAAECAGRLGRRRAAGGQRVRGGRADHARTAARRNRPHRLDDRSTGRCGCRQHRARGQQARRRAHGRRHTAVHRHRRRRPRHWRPRRHHERRLHATSRAVRRGTRGGKEASVRGPVDQSRPHPPSLSPRLLTLAGWSAFALAGALFLAIAWNVTARTALVALDGRIATWLHGHGSRPLTIFFLAVTNLHSPAAMAAWSLIFAGLLARMREWYWILTLAASVAGGMLVNTFLKSSYERLRPHFDNPLLVLESFSFPSGHTAGAVLFYGVLAAFLVSRFYDPRRRAAVVAAAMLAVVLVAFSRMYLGAHYLSDVVAAACSSAVWLVLCLSAAHALVRGKLRLEWLGGAIVIVLLIATAVLIPEEWWSRFEDAIANMHPIEALLVFCVAYAAALLLLLPAWIFPLAAGALFGFAAGLLAAELGVALSALAGWALARYALRRWIERAARRSKTFKAIDHTVAKEPKKIVLLFRMTPAVPCGLKSYFLGLTRVRLGDYLFATVLGVLPDLVIKVWLGAAGRDAFARGGVANWALLVAGIGALLILTLIVGCKLRQRIAV